MKPVAITGIGCRLPAGNSPAQLWRSLCAGESGIREIPEERYESEKSFDPRPGTPGKLYTTKAGLVDDPSRFDATFFGISGREAEKLDPQARMLLNVTFEALQDAHLVPEELQGSETGVYVGSLYAEYERAFLLDPTSYDVYAWAGTSMRSGLAGRLSTAFDFRGPSVMVDTACSSSLAALHLACRALQTSDCSLAVAGGANLLVDPVYTMGYSSASMLAGNGHAKPFCQDADGTVRADGVAMVVLKLLDRALADGDPIYAVVRGGAINHGGASSPYMQPSESGQADLLGRALRDARVQPSEVQYLEAHGTGTKVGDPIELRSIAGTLCNGQSDRPPLLVGSIKGNIGHTEGTAGLAGVIKVALSLSHRKIPPTIHATPATSAFEWERWPLEVCTELRDWPLPEAELIAGVNSFGVTGINAHVVLSEAPPNVANSARPATAAHRPRRPQLLLLSGHSHDSLEAAAANFVDHPFDDGDDLGSICRSAAERAMQRSHRLAALVESKDDIAAVLSEHLADVEGSPLDGGIAGAERRPVVFVFSGQGSQWLGMGLELFESEPVFRSAIEQWAALADDYLDWSILEELHASSDASRLDRLEVIQPMLAAMQFALARLWQSWGITPDAVVGHSLGEVTAAQAAGALTLADAVRITCQRSRVLQTATGLGSMIATELTYDQALEYVARHPDRLSAACSNSPKSTVLSGETTLLDEIYAELEGRSSFVRRVKVDVPAHSSLLEPLRESCLEAIGDVESGPVRLPFYSSVDPDADPSGLALDHDYWWRNMRHPVLFSQAIGRLAADGFSTFIEVSPHPIVTVPVMQSLSDGAHAGLVLHTLKRGLGERAAMLTSLGKLFCAGSIGTGGSGDECSTGPRWSEIFPGGGEMVRLPPYGFAGERYWHAPGSDIVAARRGRDHPLVDRAVHSALTPRARHHDLALDLDEQPYLRDHQVGGQPVFPATGYIEVALAGANGTAPLSEAEDEEQLFRLENVDLSQVMVLSDQVDRAAQVVFRELGRGLGVGFEILSRQAGMKSDDGWTRHAGGTLTTISGPSTPRWPDLAEPGQDELDVGRHYAAVERRDIRYEAAFRTVEQAWRLGPGEILARLSDGLADLEFVLDPTLLDGALQTLFLALESSPGVGDRLLPARIGEVYVVPGRRPRWVRTSAVIPEDGASVTADLWLYDDEGRPSALLLGVEFRRAERADAVARLIYSQRWQPLSPPEDARGGNGAGNGQATDPSRASTLPNRWLVLGDPAAVAEEWLALWSGLHPEHRYLLVSGASASDGASPAGVERMSGSLPDDASAIVARCADLCSAGDTLGVLHLASLGDDLETSDGRSAGDFESLREAHVLGLAALARALEDGADSLPASLETWFVTRNAMAVTPSQEAVSTAQASLWGLVHSLRVEHPRFGARLVDLDAADSPADCAGWLAEVLGAPSLGENRLAIRAGERWAPRLQRAAGDGAALSAGPESVGHEAPFRTAMSRPGVLERLRLEATRRTQPRAGEVEIQVRASGLNFHDVFVAMGLLDPDAGDLADSLGLECSGVVASLGEGVAHLEIGQPVVAVARGCMGSYAMTDAHLACPKPAGLSFEEAAAIPITFLTAHYALVEHARLEAGESVLVHAGSGGVGFAAVQIAKELGARIFSTASRPKHDYVRGLGVDEVYDSRTLDFAEEILAATGDRGVDVVLNSLAGEFQRKSLEILAPYGRFVEIGKADIAGNGQLDLARFDDNRSFVAIDVAQRCQDRPHEVGRRLADLVGRFDRGELSLPPIERFPLDRVADAFAHMAEAKHRGKIVLKPDSEANAVHPAGDRAKIHPDAGYVVIGGGGIGGALIDWLQERGARHIAVVSRSGRSDPERGERVSWLKGDVGDAASLARAFAEIEGSLPPIAGVVHAAGSTDDAALVSLSEDQVHSVARAKMEGLENLHRAIARHPLDFVLLCSSATWFLGSHGQANYGAANAFVEATAQAWRRKGIPATALHFGPWSEVGIIARAGDGVADRLTDRGFAPISPERAVAAVESVLARDVTSAAIMDFEADKWLSTTRAGDRELFYEDLLATTEADSEVAAPANGSNGKIDLSAPGEDRVKAIEGFLVEQLRRCLRLPASSAPQPMESMRGLGLDSLMAMEMSLRIEEALEKPVPAGVLLQEGMSISRLAEDLSGSL